MCGGLDGVGVDGEGCNKRYLLVNHHIARVLGVVVAPCYKVVCGALGFGCECGRLALDVEATAGDGAMGARANCDIERAVALKREDGTHFNILGHLHNAWIHLAAIAPEEELIACIGCGGEGCSLAVGIRARAANRAVSRLSNAGRVHVNLKQGCEGGVFQNHECTCGALNSIGPFHKVIAILWIGREGCIGAVGVGVSASHRTLLGHGRNLVDVYLERRCERCVACGGKLQCIRHFASAPSYKVIARVGCGNHLHGIAVVVSGCASDSSVVGLAYSHSVLVDGERRCELHIGCHGEGAEGISIAVAPANKMVALGCVGMEGGCCAHNVLAVASNGAVLRCCNLDVVKMVTLVDENGAQGDV